MMPSGPLDDVTIVTLREQGWLWGHRPAGYAVKLKIDGRLRAFKCAACDGSWL